MTIVWMRKGRVSVAHAFAEQDLSAGFVHIEPVATCGRFRVSALSRDANARRCGVCERVVRETA